MLKTIFGITRMIFDLMCLNIKFEKIKQLRKKNKMEEHDKLVSEYVTNWAKSVLNIAHVTVSATGLSNIPTDETVIFVCNHQSFFDIPVLLSSLDKPYGLLSKDEVKRIPFIAKCMIELNCIFVKRENPRNAVKALGLVGEKLDKGYSMIIFPEGTRSKTGEVSKFKHGAFKLATTKKISIVPIALDGTLDVFEGNNHIFKPNNIKLEVLPKIPVSDDTNYKDLTKEAFDVISKCVEKMRQN